jgi:hypothetical protein
MSYQRIGSEAGSYVAQSHDGGATWDTLKTVIATDGLLPRIAHRDRDGLYLASYQVDPGNNALRMFVKTTTDVHDWSAPPQPFATEGNNHDSLPVVMPDGTFALFWIRANGSQFDIAVRRSADGLSWEQARVVTASPGADDVEPHPLVGVSASAVDVYWGRAEPAGGLDYDIVQAAGVVIGDAVFADGFDRASRR